MSLKFLQRSPFRYCGPSCSDIRRRDWTPRKQEHAVSVIQRAAERTMGENSLYTQVQKGMRSPSSVDRRRSAMPLITPKDRRSRGPDTLRDIVMAVGPGRLRTG
ncbi:hypothetical protein V3C99_003162 [Haemonchus contortus]